MELSKTSAVNTNDLKVTVHDEQSSNDEENHKEGCCKKDNS